VCKRSTAVRTAEFCFLWLFGWVKGAGRTSATSAKVKRFWRMSTRDAGLMAYKRRLKEKEVIGMRQGRKWREPGSKKAESRLTLRGKRDDIRNKEPEELNKNKKAKHARKMGREGKGGKIRDRRKRGRGNRLLVILLKDAHEGKNEFFAHPGKIKLRHRTRQGKDTRIMDSG